MARQGIIQLSRQSDDHHSEVVVQETSQLTSTRKIHNQSPQVRGKKANQNGFWSTALVHPIDKFKKKIGSDLVIDRLKQKLKKWNKTIENDYNE